MMTFLCDFSLAFMLGLNIMPYAVCNEDEPRCTSRYDFEAKLLKYSVKLEFEMSVLKDKYKSDMETLQTTTSAALSKLESLSEKLNDEQNSKLTHLDKLENEFKQNFSHQVSSLENKRKTNEEDFAELYKNLLSKMDAKLEEIKNQVARAPVVFLSKNMSNRSPSHNEVMIFTDTVTNIGNGYDAKTGYFTAPFNGTYSFAVQICYRYSHYFHVMVYADDVLISNALYYDSAGVHPCSTLHTFAYLVQGARVCAKNGPSSSSGSIVYYNEADRWSMFMGALVH